MGKRATAIIIRNGTVLLMRRQKPGKDYCILPGGGVDLDESFEDACIREVKEETGLDVTSLRQVRMFYGLGEQDAYFLVSVGPGEPVLGGVEARRHSPENLYTFIWAGDG